MAVSLKRTAHEHLKALAFDEKKNRKWDVHIPKQVDVMRISNVVNDEFPRDELFRVAVVGVVGVVVICVLMVRVIMPFVVRVVVVVIRIFGVSVLGIVAIRFMPVVLCPKP